MNLGKCPENVLKRSVFKQLNRRRDDIICRPDVGCGSAVVKAGDMHLVTHTEVFFGSPREIAYVAVAASASALMVKGAVPVGLELAVLMPEDFEECALRKLMQLIDAACNTYGMEVLGGHTEYMPTVRELTLTVTAFGYVEEILGGATALKENTSAEKMPATVSKQSELKMPLMQRRLFEGAAKAGDDLVMTKWAGLYGTAVIAGRNADALKKRYYPDFIEETAHYFENLSVLREIEIAKQFDISVMYGIAKGGIFGALWEVAVAGKVGLFVDLKKIPLKQQTVEICNYYDIHPYKLSGYGALLIAAPQGGHLAAALERNGIPAAVIGQCNDSNDRVVVNDDEIRYLEPPRGSELWKFLCDGGKDS